MAAWRKEMSLLVLKNISLVPFVHSWNIFHHSKRNLVSPRSHVISSIDDMQSVHNFLVQAKVFAKISRANHSDDFEFNLEIICISGFFQKVSELIFKLFEKHTSAN